MRLTIIARKADGTIVPPRTKKNSPQLIPNMEYPILVPSEAYREWERAAISSAIRSEVITRDRHTKEITFREATINYPVNCRALIYRDRNVGDANGYYQGIADLLEKIGVVVNDRLIVSWDGSRLRKDPDRPRIEVELTPAEDGLLWAEDAS